MSRSSTVVFVVLALGLCGIGTAAAQTGWTVVDLGVGDGTNAGNHPFYGYWGNSINNLGNVAYTLGNQQDYESGSGPSPYPQSYFYNKSGKTTVAIGALKDFGTDGDAEVYGINANNIVVGQSWNGGGFDDAMAWKWNGSTGGTMIDLMSAIGSSSGGANNGNCPIAAINDSNQATGAIAYSGNNGYITPYTLNLTNAFSNGSTPVTWLNIPGGTGTLHGGEGISINSSGCVVSQGIDIGPTTNSYYDGGDPTLSSSYTKPMPKPSGDTASRTCYTSAINNAGYVLATAPTAAYPVGWVLDTAPGSNTVTYDQDVPPIAAGGTDVPMAPNNNAAPLVVGYASTSSGAQHAFVWEYGTATATDLNSYAASLGATNLSGWVFTEADSVNNNGEIVGYGTLNGVDHAFAWLNYSGPGDANGDGKVDINDLTIVLAHYNQTGVGWPAGDFNGDGKVDINDLTIVLANYGHTYGSSGTGMAAVPEPGALALLAAALLALLAWRGGPNKPMVRGGCSGAGSPIAKERGILVERDASAGGVARRRVSEGRRLAFPTVISGDRLRGNARSSVRHGWYVFAGQRFTGRVRRRIRRLGVALCFFQRNHWDLRSAHPLRIFSQFRSSCHRGAVPVIVR